MNIKRKLILSIICASLAAGYVYACSVPVFRYALERWPADSYSAIVVHEGELNENAKTIISYLESQTRNEEDGALNLDVYTADVTSDKDSQLIEFAKEHKGKTTTLCLLYPRMSGKMEPIWKGDLTMDNATLLTTSKVMNDISEEILKGRTAVWILLESGDKEKDEKAYNALKDNLIKVEEEMGLPDGVITPDGEVTGGPEAISGDPSNYLEAEIPLQISFSIKRVSRDDISEKILLSILLNMEEDLDEYKDEPMVFPVFGQGRALEPLVGGGINEDNVMGMSYYLCGPCSCQIKMQNPGVDLLVNKDWYAYLEGYEIIKDKELPPLSGIADLVEGPAEPEVVEEQGAEEDAEETVSRLRAAKRNVIITALAVLVIIVAGSLVVRNKQG